MAKRKGSIATSAGRNRPAKNISENLTVISPKKETKILTVFTAKANPFGFGRGMSYIGFNLDTSQIKTVKVGKGIEAFVLESPITKGVNAIVESQTGAIIGTSLSEVKKDIKTADEEVMKRQLEQGKLQAAKALVVAEEDFWKRYRRA